MVIRMKKNSKKEDDNMKQVLVEPKVESEVELKVKKKTQSVNN